MNHEIKPSWTRIKGTETFKGCLRRGSSVLWICDHIHYSHSDKYYQREISLGDYRYGPISALKCARSILLPTWSEWKIKIESELHIAQERINAITTKAVPEINLKDVENAKRAVESTFIKIGKNTTQTQAPFDDMQYAYFVSDLKQGNFVESKFEYGTKASHEYRKFAKNFLEFTQKIKESDHLVKTKDDNEVLDYLLNMIPSIKAHDDYESELSSAQGSLDTIKKLHEHLIYVCEVRSRPDIYEAIIMSKLSH